MGGLQENLLLKNVLTHGILLIPNIWLERKIIQPIKQMFSLLTAKHLGNEWGHFLFTGEFMAIVTQGVFITMRTEHENDRWHDSPWTLWWNIYQVCVSPDLIFKCWLLGDQCQHIFKCLLHEKQRHWAKKNTISSLSNRRKLPES